MECQRLIADWLLELYHVKQEIASVFDAQLEKAGNPELHSKIEREIEDTLNEAEIIKDRLEELDRDILATNSDLVNWVKDTQAMAPTRIDDQVIRFAVIKYTLTYLERVIIEVISTIAAECSDQRTISLCEKLINKTREIQESLDQEIHGAVTDVINRSYPEKDRIDMDEGQF